jgi:hypothetical protein
MENPPFEDLYQSDIFWGWEEDSPFEERSDAMKHQVGDGEHISLWHDHWNPDGPLREKYHCKIIYDSTSNLSEKLSKFNSPGQWNWPAARSDELVCIQERLFDIPLEGMDKVEWLPAANKKYNCRDTWEFI